MKYNEPNISFDEKPDMVCEPIGVSSYSTKGVPLTKSQWEKDDAPCRYSIDELNTVISQSLADKADGKVHSHHDVQQMVMARIQAWK